MADKKRVVSKKLGSKQTAAESVSADNASTGVAAAHRGADKGEGTRKARGATPVSATGKTPANALRRMVEPDRPSTSGNAKRGPGAPPPAPKPESGGDQGPAQETQSVSTAAGARGSAAADTATGAPIGSEEREAIIREAAYFKAEKRSFEPGFETQDWVEAERELEEKLAKQ